MNRKYFPRGAVKSLSRKLGISTQAVYQRLKRGDEDTIDLLEKIIQSIIQSQQEQKQRARMKYDFLKKIASYKNGLS